jgi:RNA polymerase sigma-70 factor, ECF subfamily
MAALPGVLTGFAHLGDEEVVSRVLAGETTLFEIIIRRYNQLLYRLTRSILHDDMETEDVMHETYVRAYEHLSQFAGRAQFRTWLSRIAINEALARVERRKRFHKPDPTSPRPGDDMDDFASTNPSPEQEVVNAEMRHLVENAIARLPETYRCVFVLRDVEQVSTEEVARILNLSESTVKVRLHRARRTLRRTLFQRTGEQVLRVFPFDAIRCDRIVAGVFARISQLESNA